MKLRTRLLIILLGAALVVPVVGWVAYRVAAAALVRDASARLEAVRRVVTDAVGRETDAWRAQAAALAEGRQTREALREFARAVELLESDLREGGLAPDDALIAKAGGELRGAYEKSLFPALAAAQGKVPETGAWLPTERRSILLQHALIASNPAPAGRKGEQCGIGDLLESPEPLRTAFARTRYAAGMQRHRPGWELLAQRGPLADVCLVDASGYVLSSLRHTMVLAQNLRDPQHRTSAPARAFRAAMLADGPTTRRVVIEDAAPSEWDGGEPSFWLACSVEDDLSRCIGAVLIRVPASRLTQLATFRGREDQVGLGRSGGSVIVGADGLLRTEHRFVGRLPPSSLRRVSAPDGSRVERTAILAANYAAHPAVRALQRALDPAANAGLLEATDEGGEPILCAYGPVRADDFGWGALVWITRAEGVAAATALRNVMLFTLGGVLLAGLTIAWITAGSIARPLTELARAAERIGQGDDTLRVPVKAIRSETGILARAFNGMLDAQQAQRAKEAKEHRDLSAAVEDLSQVAAALGTGDLRIRTHVKQGPVGRFADVFNAALDSVENLVRETQTVASGSLAAADQMARAQSAAADLAVESARAALTTQGAAAESLKAAETIAVIASTHADSARQMQETADASAAGMEVLAENLSELVELGRRSTNELKAAAEESMGAESRNRAIEEVARFISGQVLNIRLAADKMPPENAQRAALHNLAHEIEASADELARSAREEGHHIGTVLKAMRGAVAAGEETAQSLLAHADRARSTKDTFTELKAQVGEAGDYSRRIAGKAAEQQDLLRAAANESSTTAHHADNVAEMSRQTASDATALAASARHLAESAGNFQVTPALLPHGS